MASATRKVTALGRATLTTVKSLRIFVLVLLAMLLPLRGVSAAALLCEQHPASHTGMAVAVHDHATVSATAQDHAQHEHDHRGVDKGHHCLASCSATPLMSALPTVASPATAGTAVFPHFAAPAPTFQSDGQDRPPRSI